MNYAKYQSKAYAKIKQYGSPVTVIQKEGEPVYNPDTNEWETVENRIPGFAIQENFSFRDRDGTVIQQGDVSLMCAFTGKVAVNTGDFAEFGGKQRVIVAVNPLSPDGATDIYMLLQVR